MYQLVIADDTGSTTVLPFVREEFSVGRGEGNAIRLTERNVSRKHARLLLDQGAIYVEDLESANGTWVNGDRILGRVPLSAGDAVAIGDYLLSLRLSLQVSLQGSLQALAEPLPPPAQAAQSASPQRIAEVTRIGPAPQVQATVTRAPQERRRESRLPVLLLGLGGMGLIVTAGFVVGQRYRAIDRTARSGVSSGAAPVAAMPVQLSPSRATSAAELAAPAPQAAVVFQAERRAVEQEPSAQHGRRHPQAVPQERSRKASVASSSPSSAAHVEREAVGPIPPKAAEQQGSPEQGEALLKQAYDLYTNGDYGEAVRLARQGREMGAQASWAWRITGNAACNLRDLKLVDEAYRRSDPNARQSLIYVCERSGVTFGGGHFQLADGQQTPGTAQR